MIDLPTISVQRLLALALVLALHLAGMGRALATASFGPEVPSIPGVVVHLCHADARGDAEKGQTHRDCCDTCALCSPVTPPENPDLAKPAAVVRFVGHSRTLRWAPAVARRRTPRLAQGPPAA